MQRDVAHGCWRAKKNSCTCIRKLAALFCTHKASSYHNWLTVRTTANQHGVHYAVDMQTTTWPDLNRHGRTLRHSRHFRPHSWPRRRTCHSRRHNGCHHDTDATNEANMGTIRAADDPKTAKSRPCWTLNMQSYVLRVHIYSCTLCTVCTPSMYMYLCLTWTCWKIVNTPCTN